MSDRDDWIEIAACRGCGEGIGIDRDLLTDAFGVERLITERQEHFKDRHEKHGEVTLREWGEIAGAR